MRENISHHQVKAYTDNCFGALLASWIKKPTKNVSFPRLPYDPLPLEEEKRRGKESRPSAMALR